MNRLYGFEISINMFTKQDEPIMYIKPLQYKTFIVAWTRRILNLTDADQKFTLVCPSIKLKPLVLLLKHFENWFYL